MAYFECIIGGGANANIIVTYDATLYDKTITCSNGIDTYTQTTTSSGVTEFEVDAEGSWTITCNGISRTVEVIFNYNVPLTITKTIAVYGAVGATISFTDSVGSKTVTLDSNGEGSVAISYLPNTSIRFTDTNVSKNPNNLSEPYAKDIVLDSDTTEIYIMPDNALYWWGYEKDFQFCDNSYNTSRNQNSIHVAGSGNSLAYSGVCSTKVLSPTSIHGIAYRGSYNVITGGFPLRLEMMQGTSATAASLAYIDFDYNTTSYKSMGISNVSGYVGIRLTSYQDGAVYALWYE